MWSEKLQGFWTHGRDELDLREGLLFSSSMGIRAAGLRTLTKLESSFTFSGLLLIDLRKAAVSSTKLRLIFSISALTFASSD